MFIFILYDIVHINELTFIISRAIDRRTKVITPKEYINGVMRKGRKNGPLYEEARKDYRRWLRAENHNWRWTF